MMLVAAWGAWRLWPQRRSLQTSLSRPLLWTLAGMTFSGWVATVAGWYVTEIGRQPYMVQGLLRVDEVASSVPSPYIAFTLALYLTVYAALLVAYVSVMKHMAEKPVEMPGVPGVPGASLPAGAASTLPVSGKVARAAGEGAAS
jgi:cytochrome d ubiquinol oxidase subunit I